MTWLELLKTFSTILLPHQALPVTLRLPDRWSGEDQGWLILAGDLLEPPHTQPGGLRAGGRLCPSRRSWELPYAGGCSLLSAMTWITILVFMVLDHDHLHVLQGVPLWRGLGPWIMIMTFSMLFTVFPFGEDHGLDHDHLLCSPLEWAMALDNDHGLLHALHSVPPWWSETAHAGKWGHLLQLGGGTPQPHWDTHKRTPQVRRARNMVALRAWCH